MHAIYPGSFDPITKGHLDIIKRGLSVFDEITVTIMENNSKKGFFSTDDKRHLMSKTLKGLDNVYIDQYDDLLVNYLDEIGAYHVIRGLRDGHDLSYERNWFRANQDLGSKIEVFYLICSRELEHISSTLARDLIKRYLDPSMSNPDLSCCLTEEEVNYIDERKDTFMKRYV